MKEKYKIVLDCPKIILDRITGLHPFYSYICIKAKQFINPKTIIDVGANCGMFTKSFRKYFPNAKVITFEPTKEFANTLAKSSDYFFPVGLGDKNQIMHFHYKKDNHGQSSFLERTDNNAHSEDREIQVKRFDSVDVKIQRPCLVKIDVEGFELKVLKGFGERLKEVDGVILEYNIDENYKGQPTIKEITEILDKYGIKKMRIITENVGGADLFFYR